MCLRAILNNYSSKAPRGTFLKLLFSKNNCVSNRGNAYEVTLVQMNKVRREVKEKTRFLFYLFFIYC